MHFEVVESAFVVKIPRIACAGRCLHIRREDQTAIARRMKPRRSRGPNSEELESQNKI